MIKDRQDFQELQQRIYEYDQQQLKVYENRVRKGLGLDEKETPKRVMTTSSRVKRDNFKLTRLHSYHVFFYLVESPLQSPALNLLLI